MCLALESVRACCVRVPFRLQYRRLQCAVRYYTLRLLEYDKSSVGVYSSRMLRWSQQQPRRHKNRERAGRTFRSVSRKSGCCVPAMTPTNHSCCLKSTLLWSILSRLGLHLRHWIPYRLLPPLLPFCRRVVELTAHGPAGRLDRLHLRARYGTSVAQTSNTSRIFHSLAVSAVGHGVFDVTIAHNI